MNCWICGGVADTREHTLKVSDLKQYFGPISQKRPLFHHEDSSNNLRLNTVRAEKLTSSTLLCGTCNNSSTQEHDKAWERTSAYLHKSWPTITRHGHFDLSKVFPGGTKAGALDVHLYFLKLFGCRVHEGKIPIDTSAFATAIRERRAHPHVFLTVAATPPLPIKRIANISDINTLQVEGAAIAAAWTYTFAPVCIRILYATESSRYQPKKGCWHPDSSTKLVKLGKYEM